MGKRKNGTLRARAVGVVAIAAGGATWTLLPAGGEAAQPRASGGQNLIAPTAKTGTADHLHTTSAVLHATVNPNRSPTAYRFQYGKTTSYGRSTPVANAGTGAAPVPVTARVSGLAPGTAYHFRVVATNAVGSATGQDSTFTTRDPRLGGRFRVRLRIRGAGGVYGHSRRKLSKRTYAFRARCNGALCPRVKLKRTGQRGHFRSTLKRTGPGAYRGVERFRRGYCNDGLRFHSKARVKVEVRGTHGDRASRIGGSVRVRVSGCASGRERASFRGKAR